MPQPLKCPTCRKPERRLVSNLPRNYGLVDAARLDLTAAFSGLDVGSSSSSVELQRILLDDRELRLSAVTIGLGATSTVVEGTYEGQPVSAAVQFTVTWASLAEGFNCCMHMLQDGSGSGSGSG
jgi:hypothetical protein